ncbi:RIO1 family domain-containing protein [Ditylenchus destructor]|nr:RIO1 family domain-containing protein [Ditylenchus destructor]
MGKFNVQHMRFLEAGHFRLLVSIEMGMKNHEVVPLPLISSIAQIHRGATARYLNDLTRIKVVAYERGKRYDGFRLTTLGYDYLALRALCAREVIGSVGNQIGVGKESDIYVGGDPLRNDLVLKFHRLGRTSFRKIKEKRDYHQRRHFCSWLYLSRIAAIKEFAFLKALHSRKFPVPKPIDVYVESLFDKLIRMIVRLASYGLIHGDFNEFNIILLPDEEPILIDFPQMVSIDHQNAEFYFDRDINCIRDFFRRKFTFECTNDLPKFSEVKRKHNLDVELEASGFTKLMALDLNKAYDEGNFEAHMGDESSDESESLEDVEEEDPEIDQEELRETIKDSELQKQHLEGTERFTSWLNEAQTQLEKVVLVEQECPALVEMDDNALLKYKEASEEVERKLLQMEDVGDEEAIEEEASAVCKTKRRVTEQRGKVTDNRSVYSSGSTIAPDEIKRRLLMEKGKRKKEKLRAKGRQCATQRGRRENINLMKEYAGWDKY